MCIKTWQIQFLNEFNKLLLLFLPFFYHFTQSTIWDLFETEQKTEKTEWETFSELVSFVGPKIVWITCLELKWIKKMLIFFSFSMHIIFTMQIFFLLFTCLSSSQWGDMTCVRITKLFFCVCSFSDSDLRNMFLVSERENFSSFSNSKARIFESFHVLWGQW